MAEFKVNRGFDDFLSSPAEVIPGTLSVSEDGRRLYFDIEPRIEQYENAEKIVEKKRIVLTDVIDITGGKLTDGSSIKDGEFRYFDNKIYIDGSKLLKYTPTNGLEVISNLDSSVIILNEEFDYDGDSNVVKVEYNYPSESATIAPRIGSIVIDSAGDFGFLTEYDNEEDTITVTVLKQTHEAGTTELLGYDIYVNSAYDGTQYGTMTKPYNNWNSLYNDHKSILENPGIEVTIHITSDSSLNVSAIKNLKNVNFVGTGRNNISFANDENTRTLYNFKDVTLKNLKCSITGTIYNSTNLLFKDCELNNDFVLQDSTNTKLVNVHGSGIIIDNSIINSLENISFSLVAFHNMSSPVYIYNSNINEVTVNSSSDMMLSLFNTNCVSLTTDNILSCTLVGGKISDICIINAENIDLGTCIIPSNAALNGNVKTISGLSSKQVYDNKHRNYNNKNETLESHLDAIDSTLKGVTDKLYGETDITQALVSKTTFTATNEIENIENFRVGDVMKYVGNSGLSYEINHDLTLIGIRKDIVNNDIYDEDGETIISTESRTFYDFTFELADINYLAKYGDKITLHCKLPTETTGVYNEKDFELSITETKVNGNLNHIKARIENTETVDVNSYVLDAHDNVSTEYSNYSGTFVQKLVLNFGDRIIKVNTIWDKISGSSGGDSGNYYIVGTYDELNTIMTYNTRPMGILAYVQDDELMYQWRYNDAGEKDWDIFSSGTGAGGGGGLATLQYCKPSNKAHQYNKYNYTLQVPLIYYNNEDEIQLSYYVSTTISGTVTYNLYKEVSGTRTLLSTGALQKGEHTLSVTKEQIADTTGEYQIEAFSSEGRIYVTDADGNALVDYLRYTINAGTISLATNFNQSNIYLLDETNPLNNEDVDITVTLKMDSGITCKKLALEVKDINDNIVQIKNDDNELVDELILRENFFVSSYTNTINNILTERLPHIVSGDYKLHFYAIYTVNGTDRSFDVYQLLHLMIANKINLQSVVLDSSSIHSYVSPAFTASMLSTVNTTAMECYYYLYQDTDNDVPDFSNVTNSQLVATDSKWIKVDLGTKTANYKKVTEFLAFTNKISTAGEYKLAFIIKQTLSGSSYLSNCISEIPIQITISNDSAQEPVTNTVGDECLIMNFDMQRTADEDITSQYWNSSVGNYQIKFSGVVNTDTIGTNVRETVAEENNNLSAVNDRYVRLFGDAKGVIITTDSNGNETNYQAFKEQNTVNNGFTIEILFRANYTGDIHTAVMKLAGQVGLNIKYDEIEASIIANSFGFDLVENKWTHIMLVVDNNKKPADYNDTITTSSAYTNVAHCAIYINGVIAKTIPCPTGFNTNVYNAAAIDSSITFNVNEYDEKEVFGLTDLKVFRLYNRRLTPEEILRNYHSCIPDQSIRESEIKRNQLSEFSEITEIYFIRNTGTVTDASGTVLNPTNNPGRKSNISNITFEGGGGTADVTLNTITDKATSKANCVNCSVLMVRLDATGKKEYQFYKNVDILLQGTSTLRYPVKNYRVRYYTEDGRGKKLKLEFENPSDGVVVNLDGENEFKTKWKPEYQYTMKCDYMESSHMNNTGIARYINDNIYENVSDTDELRLTPSQELDDSYRIVIDGFPSVLYIIDDKTAAESAFTLINSGNYTDSDITNIKSSSGCKLMGTYMYNLDKEANENYGFLHEDDDGNVVFPYLQSLEITANDDLSSGAFNKYTGTNVDADGNLYKSEQDFYATSFEARCVYDELETIDESLVATAIFIEDNEEEEYDIVQIVDGEYVIPGVGVYPMVNGTINTSINLNDGSYNINGTLTGNYRKAYNEDFICYNGIAQCINFINANSGNSFKNLASKFLDLRYCIDYYILTMTFGMVDNLGKNLMINSWNYRTDNDGNIIPIDPKFINPNDISESTELASKWYPSFYDMDTCLGLNNVGTEYIDADAEMQIDYLCGYVNKGIFDPNTNTEYDTEYTTNIAADSNYDPYGDLYPQYSNWLNYFTVNGQAISQQSAYRYPRELVEMMIKLHYDESLMTADGLDSATINTLLSEKQNVKSTISSDSNYKYYWQAQFILTDSNGQSVESATIENANFVRLTWVVFDLNKQEITVPPETETKRFKSYNTTSSKLWSKIASIYESDIYKRYAYLRLNGLDSTTIINKLRTFSSDAIPKAYYNSNAISKYLLADYGAYDATTIMKMCNGDRKIKLEKWLKDRFNFVDTIIQSNSIAFPGSEAYKSLIIYPNTTSVVPSDFYISTFTPQYVTVQTDQTGIIRQYVNENSQDNENFMGRKFTKMFNQGKVEVIYCANNISSLISLDTLNPRDTISLANFTKAKELVIAENGINSAINNIIFVDTSIERTEDHHFNRVVIHSSSITSLDLSTMPFIEELDLSNCTALANLTLAENARIKTIKLRNCKSLTSLRMVGLFQLSNIDFTGCNALNELTIINTPQLLSIDLSELPLTKLTVNEIGFNELTLDSLKNIVTIAIEDKNMKTFKLTNSTMDASTSILDLSKCPNLAAIDIRGTAGVSTLILPKNTNTEAKSLGIAGCSNLSCIGFADEDETVENTRQPNTFNFKYFYKSASTDTMSTRDLDFIPETSYYSRFYLTKVTTITDLYTNSVTATMFRQASSLTTIKNSYLATTGTSIGELFRNTKIQTFTNTTLSFPNATSAYMAFGWSTISKAAFKKVIDACGKLTSIARICDGATFISNNTTFDTNWFTNNPITDMTRAFANSNVVKITASNFLKTSATTKRTTLMMFYGCSGLTSIPATLLQSNGVSGFGDIRAMFASCVALTTPTIINNLTGLTNVSGLYANCTKLNLTMANFKNQLESASNYFGGSIISGSSINDFIYSSIYKLANVTKADAMFYRCLALSGVTQTITTSSGVTVDESCIPENLFENNTSLTSVKSMFYGCTGLTTILPDVLFNNSKIVYADGFFTNSYISGTVKNTLFTGCTGLKNLGPTTINTSYSQLSLYNRDSLSNITNNVVIVNNEYETSITLDTGGFFQKTRVTEYEPNLLDPLVNLQYANYLFSGKSTGNSYSSYFEGCTNRMDATIGGYSIDSTIFAKNTKLIQAAFAFSHNRGITLPIHPNVLVAANGYNHSALTRIDGMFEGCINIDNRSSEEPHNIIKLSHLTNLVSCSGLFSGCKWYRINAIFEDPTDEFYNEDINRIFMNMNNLTYTSFMFSNCGLIADFKNDEIFSSTNLQYVQHMFNQIYLNSNSLQVYRTETLTETDINNLPINYLANDTINANYHHLNYNIISTITGKIPRYLFRNKVKLVNTSYFFAGTGISEFIPKTIFDIPANHSTVTYSYSNTTFSVYDATAGGYVNKNNVYFYEDPNGLYYTVGLDDATQRIQMALWEDGIIETRYSMYENFQYSEDIITASAAWKTKFDKLTNISYMFAYCTKIQNGEPVYSGTEFDDSIVSGLTSLTITEKQITSPFKYNGYVITIDEDVINDDTIKKFVVSDLENVFREYNPETDINKNKYILNNDCLELFDAATILNDEPDGIIVNLPKVYAVHPNTLIFLSVVTNINGLFEGCNELQGCISDVMLDRNTFLQQASRVFANCANIYGFIDNSGINQIVSLFTKNFATIKNISGFFYNCQLLGALGKQMYLSANGLEKYGSTAAYVKVASLVNSIYTNGFLVYLSGGTYLTKMLTNVSNLFYNCSNATGGIPSAVLTNNRYCNLSNEAKQSMFFNCTSMETYNEYSGKAEVQA